MSGQNQKINEIIETHIEKLNDIIGKHEEYNEKIKNIKKLIDKQKINNQRLSSVQTEKITLESQIDSLKNKIEELNDELAKKNESGNTTDNVMQKLRLEIENYKNQESDFESKIENLNQKIENLQNDITTKNEEVLIIKQQIVELETEKKQYLLEINNLKDINKKNLHTIEELKLKIEELLKDNNIATDMQNILNDLKQELEKKEIELKDKESIIFEMKTQTVEVLGNLETYNLKFLTNVESLEEQMKENFKLLDSLTSELEENNSDGDSSKEFDLQSLPEILDKVNNYDATNTDLNKISFVQNIIKNIEKVKGNFSERIKPIINSIYANNNNIDKLKIDIDDLLHQNKGYDCSNPKKEKESKKSGVRPHLQICEILEKLKTKLV
jgi:chromosome segregation ATPase